MKKNIVVVMGAVSLVCSVIAIGAVLVWAQPCHGSLELANGNMMPMRCAYTGKIALLMSGLLALASLASMVAKKPFTLAVVAASCALALLPVETFATIGVCKSSDMACQAMAAWLMACGGVSAAAALVGFALNPERKRAK